MNLKGFKKVQEDEQKATLKNQHGHSITIAKKALSKQHLEALKNFPLYAADGTLTPPEISDEEPQDVQAAQPPQDNQSVAPDNAPDNTVTQTNVNNAQPQASITTSGQQGAATQQTPQQIFQQNYDQYQAKHSAEFGQEAAKYAQDLANGHITPETYHDLFAKKDTLGKIGTIFGLVLSGIGSGMTHQPSMALQMMNNELNNDLEAQKNSKANAQNYLRLNQQNEMNKANIQKMGAETKLIGAQTQGSLADAQIKADTHAKNQMLLGTLHHLEATTNNLPPGPIKAQAGQALNGVTNAVQQKIQQNSAEGVNALMSNPEGEFQKKVTGLRTMGMLGMEGADTMANSLEAKHVPGFGDASTPVPSDVRQELIAKQDYNQAAKRYVDFAKEHAANWANLNPIQRAQISKEGAVLGAELQGKYRMKTHGGVYKTGEQEYIQKIIPDNAVSWASSFNQIPKVEQTIKDNAVDTSTLAKGYGLPTPNTQTATSQKQQKSMPAEGATGSHNGKPVVFKNGKWAYK